MTSSTKPEVHNLPHCRQEEKRATATGNMYRKSGEIWTRGFEMYERTDKQTETDKHTL